MALRECRNSQRGCPLTPTQVINAIMTVVLGLCGFFMIPDYPNRPNRWSFWLTARHAELAVARTERYGRAASKRFTWASIKRAVRTPLFYLIPALYVATVLAQAGYSYFNLWLKSLTNADGTKRWSTNDVLVIPIGGNAIAVVLVWVCGWISDRLGTRHMVVFIQAIVGLIPAIIMSIWNVSDAAKYASCKPKRASGAMAADALEDFLSFTVLCTAPPIFSWLSDLLPHDAEVRAFILGWAIALYYAICENLCQPVASPLTLRSLLVPSSHLAGERGAALQIRLEGQHCAVARGDRHAVGAAMGGDQDH